MEKSKWYVFCHEIIPYLITLGIALEPITDMESNIRSILICIDAVLAVVLILTYIIGGFYFVRRKIATFREYIFVSQRMIIVEAVICAFGAILAFVLNDPQQYYVLAGWFGLSIWDYYDNKFLRSKGA